MPLATSLDSNPKAKNPIPEGFRTLTPHITVAGAAKYIDFLKRAFNAVEVSRSSEPGGKLMHAHVRIGDADLMLNDHLPEFGAPPIAAGNWPLTFHLYVRDADAVFAQAVSAGCTVVMPIADQFWGERYVILADPSGHHWSMSMVVKMSPEEMAEKRKAVMSMFSNGKEHPGRQRQTDREIEKNI